MRSAVRAKSRLARLRGWRCCASIIALTALLTLLGPAHAAQLSLTWTDASTNEDGFKLERKTGTTGAYGQLATVAAGTTGYVDGAVTAGTTYCYRLRAYNSAGDSAYSNEACAAAASATLYTVAVTKTGSGSGTVASSPAAIDCGSTCSASVASGTSIALSATPTTGSTFSGWSGACTGTGSCALVVDAAKSLTATFVLQAYALTVTKAGIGSGTVTSSPSGINCGSTCSASYSSGTSVTLTPAPAAGSTFSGWSGGGCSGTGTCTVSMIQAQSVTAMFVLSAPTAYGLTLTKSGAGTGIVASNPGGINCGSTCGAYFTTGTTVTLEALPDAGSTFTGWSGACTGAASCTVTMGPAQTVTATFALQTATLTVAKSGPGNGTITSSPSGIACSSTCSASFPLGLTVALTVATENGISFAGWSGACTGTGVCRVTLNQSKSVTAKFNRKRK